MAIKINRQLLSGALAGAIFAVLGYGVGRYLPDLVLPGGRWEAALAVLITGFGAWLALAFHELAHLWAGLRQGFRFELYVAGFLGARRDGATGRTQFFFNTDANLFGGVAATTPVAEMPDLTRRFARVVAAGPLGSLLLAAVAGGAWAIGHRFAPSGSGPWQLVLFFLLITAFFSLGFFLATTLPARTGMFFTDRARYFRLTGGGPAADVERAALELVAYTQTDKPLEAMNSSHLERLVADADYHYLGRYYAYFYHLARGEAAVAAGHAAALAELPAGMPATFRAELLKEYCFALATLTGEAAAARDVWASIKKVLTRRQDAAALRVRAAMARLDGDHSTADQLTQRARDLLDHKKILTGMEGLEKRLLEAIAESEQR